jgi:hypothetical protein
MKIGDKIVERYEGRTATASQGIVRIVYIIKSINEIDQTCECELIENNEYLTITQGKMETLPFNFCIKNLINL